MKQTFYSNGKLLITAEYLVLKGALALALPTKMGQTLEVLPIDEKKIYWKSYDFDGSIWLDIIIDFEEIITLQKSENTIKNQLIVVLYYAYKQNNFLQNNGFEIVTKLSFSRNWGLGSSSTLINNIAQWLQIDGYELLKNTFGGSGYDLANAKNDFPITYQLFEDERKVTKVDFAPVFKNHLYFVYLNQKRNSRDAISHFNSKKNEFEKEIIYCNQLTDNILKCNDLGIFQELILKHEKLMENILEIPTVQDMYFNDFEGVVKSLGAWGGDFCLVASKNDPTNYFKNKGYETIISFEDMIK
jgi:mevalonate kinase